MLISIYFGRKCTIKLDLKFTDFHILKLYVVFEWEYFLVFLVNDLILKIKLFSGFIKNWLTLIIKDNDNPIKSF